MKGTEIGVARGEGGEVTEIGVARGKRGHR